MGRYSGADAWIEQYFHNSPDTDREGYTSAQLEALARTHRELAQTRAPGTPLIEVHDTEHSTMVLIVNDDMPHLVSSITAYVSSEFGGIESIFHPLFVVERGPDATYLSNNDFAKVGELTEKNALAMHATTKTATPAFSYLTEKSYEAMDFIKQLRSQGERCYFTMDAGPNVKVLCLEEDLEHLVPIFATKYRLIVSKTKELPDD